MSKQQRAFWSAIQKFTFSELTEIAGIIYDGWACRECPGDALNFASALSDYAEEWIEFDDNN